MSNWGGGLWISEVDLLGGIGSVFRQGSVQRNYVQDACWSSGSVMMPCALPSMVVDCQRLLPRAWCGFTAVVEAHPRDDSAAGVAVVSIGRTVSFWVPVCRSRGKLRPWCPSNCERLGRSKKRPSRRRCGCVQHGRRYSALPLSGRGAFPRPSSPATSA